MKKTIATILGLSILLLGYCMVENFYLSHFSDTFEKKLDQAVTAKTVEEMKEHYKPLSEYFSKHQQILEQVSPRAELEQLYLSMGHLEDYLTAENLPEARVAVGEMLRILDDIRSSPAV